MDGQDSRSNRISIHIELPPLGGTVSVGPFEVTYKSPAHMNGTTPNSHASTGINPPDIDVSAGTHPLTAYTPTESMTSRPLQHLHRLTNSSESTFVGSNDGLLSNDHTSADFNGGIFIGLDISESPDCQTPNSSTNAFSEHEENAGITNLWYTTFLTEEEAQQVRERADAFMNRFKTVLNTRDQDKIGHMLRDLGDAEHFTHYEIKALPGPTGPDQGTRIRYNRWKCKDEKDLLCALLANDGFEAFENAVLQKFSRRTVFECALYLCQLALDTVLKCINGDWEVHERLDYPFNID